MIKETDKKFLKRDALFPLGEKVSMTISTDLGKGVNYEVLMIIKKELEKASIIVSITTGGISFSVNKESHDAAKSILDKYDLEMSESDFHRDDGDSAGSKVTEKKTLRTGRDFLDLGEVEGRRRYIEAMMDMVDDFDPYTDEENKELFNLSFDMFVDRKLLNSAKIDQEKYEKRENARNERIAEIVGVMRARQKQE